jgi:hypothetical protein
VNLHLPSGEPGQAVVNVFRENLLILLRHPKVNSGEGVFHQESAAHVLELLQSHSVGEAGVHIAALGDPGLDVDGKGHTEQQNMSESLLKMVAQDVLQVPASPTVKCLGLTAAEGRAPAHRWGTACDADVAGSQDLQASSREELRHPSLPSLRA